MKEDGFGRWTTPGLIARTPSLPHGCLALPTQKDHLSCLIDPRSIHVVQPACDGLTSKVLTPYGVHRNPIGPPEVNRVTMGYPLRRVEGE